MAEDNSGLVERLLSGPRRDSLVAFPETDALRALVQLQASEIRQLRAVLFGLVDALEVSGVLESVELDGFVAAAWDEVRGRAPEARGMLTATSKPVFATARRRGQSENALATPETAMTDPYRGMPAKPTPEMIEAAEALLQTAYKHHYARQFAEARELYRKLIAEFGLTDQAQTARQQLENLRGA